MVCKFKFVRPFKVQSVPIQKSEIFNFQALDPKFVLALEPRVLKLEGSSFGVRPSIYVWGAIKKCPTSSHSINKDSNTINSK